VLHRAFPGCQRVELALAVEDGAGQFVRSSETKIVVDEDRIGLVLRQMIEDGSVSLAPVVRYQHSVSVALAPLDVVLV
jgi:hypothetical protein